MITVLKGELLMSKVYFADIRARSEGTSKIEKIKKLFDKANFGDLIDEDDFTAVKIHFGEHGNDGYINPVFARQVVDKIKEFKGKPFVADTNTLYSGMRHNSIDHNTVANLHGFNFSVLDAPVIIADGLRSQNFLEVEIGGKHFNKVKIASDFVHADGMIVMSHFKGHEIAGFGGSIKNLAMGCAPAAGKKDQHSVEIQSDNNTCIACGTCAEVCPENAIVVEDFAVIDPKKCIGCGECITACPVDAIGMDWESEVAPFMERMTEYAYGAVKNKIDKVGYINFLLNITPECDCAPFSDAPLVRDIGILASKDPIALDKASYDLVNKQQGLKHSHLEKNYEPGEDKFKGSRDHTEGTIQLTYGEEIGLGKTEYELIEI